MDERGYVSQALLDRLRDDGVEFRVLGEDVTLAVTREALPGMPRRVARFAQDFDLQLVQLARVEHERWQFVLAWSDEVGRPSFLTVKALAHYYRAGRRLLRSEELLGGAPDALVAFVGLENSLRRERGARGLAPAFPAGLTTVEQDYSQPLRGADVAVLFDPPDSYRPRLDELIAIERKELLSAAAAKVERGLLRWLERRVERRNP